MTTGTERTPEELAAKARGQIAALCETLNLIEDEGPEFRVKAELMQNECDGWEYRLAITKTVRL